MFTKECCLSSIQPHTLFPYGTVQYDPPTYTHYGISSFSSFYQLTPNISKVNPHLTLYFDLV